MTRRCDAPDALPGSVEHWAEVTPDAPALWEGARQMTYAAWNHQADRLAEALFARVNLQPGDRVALCMQNRLEWFVTQAAVAKLGALLVPISCRLTPAEVHYIAADSGARAILFDREDAHALARVWTNEPPTDKLSDVDLAVGVLRSDRDDVAWFSEICREAAPVRRVSLHAPRSVVYTSGTTGRPRGVVHVERAARSREAGARDAVPNEARAGLLRNLLGAPLNHAAGQASALATHASGGCVYIMPRFDPEEALRVIACERITTTFLVPTMLSRIVNLPQATLRAHDVSSIRRIFTGASPCPQSVKERVIAYFGDHCLIESYGMTEVGIVARMEPSDHLRKPGACGRVLEDVEVQIRGADGRLLPRGEIGEIFVRTPSMIERYLNDSPPKELVAGYFATGDLGRFDEDDFLYVVDRKKDMIIVGGVNVYPAEVETALRQHPSVLDAAVYGVPDIDLGERVQAAVECFEGCSTTAAELLAFAAERLAPYKRPRAVEFMRELPRNSAGKVLKRQLREPYWAGTGKQI